MQNHMGVARLRDFRNSTYMGKSPGATNEQMARPYRTGMRDFGDLTGDNSVLFINVTVGPMGY